MTDDQLNDVLEQFRLALKHWRGDTAFTISPRAFMVALNHFEREHELRNQKEG